MLTKDLLRVSRAGGGYHPQFVDADAEELAARVTGVYQGHVGEPRETLEDALAALEGEYEFKLVRGFAKLLEREATFETTAPVEPRRARTAAFRAAEPEGVVTEAERREALAAAADSLGASVEDVEASLYGDLEARQELVAFDPRWEPATLVEQYNLSLASTALFDATEVRVRSSDPKALVSAVKRLRLLYEIRKTPQGREVVVTGPDALFRRSRRYGTRFARLLRTVARADEWTLEATIDDRGTERHLTLSGDEVSVPGTEPVGEMTFDSGVEAEFAARFQGLDLDWDLVREPEPLEAGEHVVIPDFAFDWRPPGSTADGAGASDGTADGADATDSTADGAGATDSTADGADAPFRVFFEIMGFWTPEYVEKKLSRFADLEDVAFLVAVDESLGVGEEVEDLTDGAIPYSGTVRVKDVVDALREYEADLVADAAAALPDELVPDADAVTLAALAAEYGVSESAIEDKSFPDHERVGRTLVRPAVLDDLAARIEAGMDLGEAEAEFDAYGIDDASAALSRLGYRVEWEGLGGGTVRRK